MYLSGSQNIQKSMNGLLKIKATQIDAKIANIGIINNLGEINGKIGENLIIDVDTGKVIEFKDDVTMDASLSVNTINNLSLINGKVGHDLIVNVDAGRVIQFKDNVTMDASLSVGTINKVSRINGAVGGSDLIIDAGSLSQIVEFKNDVHMKNSLVVNSYLDVSDNAYFNSNINVLKNAQIDGSLNVLRNLDVSGNIIVGKSTTTQSSSIDLKGTFYIRDPSDPNQVYMRINYEPSLYGFTFTDESGGGRYMNFRVKNPSGGYKLFYFSTSQLYANMLVYVDNWLNVSFNNRLILGDSNNSGVYLGGSFQYIPNNAVTSGLVFYNKGLNNSTAYYTNFTHNNLSNVEVPTFRMNYNNIWSKVPHTCESTLTLLDNIIANSTTITPTQFSYVSGATSNIQTQLNGKASLSGTNTWTGTNTFSSNIIVDGSANFNNNINLNSGTSSRNMITQNIISSDLSGNQNTFKYSTFSYNTAGLVTSEPLIVCKEDSSGNSINFYPRLSATNYNNMVLNNDRGIVSSGAFNNNAMFVGCHSSTKCGIRMSTSSSEPASVDIETGGTSIKLSKFPLVETMVLTTEIINIVSSAFDTTSDETMIKTNNDLYPCKYRALTHEFAKKDGTSGCVLDVKGSIKFPSSQVQTDAWNSTNAGYTKSGSTLTFANNTILSLPSGSSITFPDSSSQNTAYTTADDTKLQALGTITTGTMGANFTLTSGAFHSPSSISLVAGTYIITVNACVAVITGTTTVSQMLAGYSTSSTGLSQNINLAILNGGGVTYNIGNQWSLNSSNIITVVSTTTYYLQIQCTFGTASRFRYVQANSAFRAVRIA